MNYLWKWITNIMAVVGVILIYGGVGKSDYYLLVLGQTEPTTVWWTIGIGVLMVVPLIVRARIKGIKERQKYVQNR